MTPDQIAALNRAISKLFNRWQVDDELGSRILALDAERYRTWRLGELNCPDDDLRLRLSLLLGIHVQLCTFFSKPERGYAWMAKPNDVFGESPLSMLSSGDLNVLVRLQAYLAAETQAPF
ncbi:hypothetical protein [Bosea sp. 685]|uniref:hypothetical protein n=1 Tax=Bosea sp. 685 TaxID=3080057 RepID=UPI002892C5AE|nr:hypothetical protein [Bosea sp. 685]WNJ89576.1 hypothetical protein RMR04_24710 [Bosea sp. 685]